MLSLFSCLCLPRLSLEYPCSVSLSFWMFLDNWCSELGQQHPRSLKCVDVASRVAAPQTTQLASRNYTTPVVSFDHEIDGKPSCQRRGSAGVRRSYKKHQRWLTIVIQKSPNHDIYHTWAPHLAPQSLLRSHPPPRLPMARRSRASRLSKRPQPTATARKGRRPSTCRKGAHSDVVLRRVHAWPHSRVLWAKANTHAHIRDVPTRRLCPHAWKFT